jgi:hypothetical protein
MAHVFGLIKLIHVKNRVRDESTKKFINELQKEEKLQDKIFFSIFVIINLLSNLTILPRPRGIKIKPNDIKKLILVGNQYWPGSRAERPILSSAPRGGGDGDPP